MLTRQRMSCQVNKLISLPKGPNLTPVSGKMVLRKMHIPQMGFQRNTCWTSCLRHATSWPKVESFMVWGYKNKYRNVMVSDLTSGCFHFPRRGSSLQGYAVPSGHDSADPRPGQAYHLVQHAGPWATGPRSDPRRLPLHDENMDRPVLPDKVRPTHPAKPGYWNMHAHLFLFYFIINWDWMSVNWAIKERNTKYCVANQM